MSNRSRCGAVRIACAAGEPSAGFVRVESLPLWRRANFERELRTLSLFLAGARTGAWSVLRILFAIDDPLVVFGPSRRWRVERPHNSVRDRRPSRGFRPLAALARGASSQFCSRSMALSWFSAPRGAGFLAGARAGAWSVLRILFAIDDPLVVFGPSRRWRVERPHNSVRDRRPSRGFRPLAALARGAS